MAAPGYPGTPKKGLPIQGLEQVADSPERVVFHSGTAQSDGQWVTNGGRVLTVTARGGDLKGALTGAYGAVSRISWPDVVLRRDIGLKGVLRTRGGESKETAQSVDMASAFAAWLAELKSAGINIEPAALP
jgi:phosphoribosylamine--glycine ligase